MAIFSRITAGLVLACVATTSLLSSPVSASKAVGARHLKHPQPRAHHVPNTLTKGSKRGAAKKKACAAKSTTVSSSSTAAPTSSASSTHSKTHTAVATTSAAPKPPKTYSGGNNGSGKAGLGWTDGTVDYIHKFMTGKVSWCYTWSPWPCCTGDGCPESIPMLWSDKQAGDWHPGVYGKPSHILGFNEPDIAGESNMSPSRAVQLWWQYMEPINARRVSPAVTASPTGVAWLKSFMSQCSTCNIPVVAVHYYGMDPDDFISFIKSFHADFPDKAIWVTEWACQNYGAHQENQCSPADISNFMSKTQAFLDGADYVERYCWFAAINDWSHAPNFNHGNGLLKGEDPTALGWQYIS